MNLIQKMFYNFLIERTKDDKKDEAKKFLEDCFAKLDAGSLDKKAFVESMPKFYDMVKPEAVDEIKTAVTGFIAKF